MLGDRTCPTCRATAPVDLSLVTVLCTTCQGRLASELALARRSRRQPDEARWLLAPLLASFAAALGLVAISQLAALVVWAAASAATIAIATRRAGPSGRADRSRAALPSAVAITRRERSRRLLRPGQQS